MNNENWDEINRRSSIHNYRTLLKDYPFSHTESFAFSLLMLIYHEDEKDDLRLSSEKFDSIFLAIDVDLNSRDYPKFYKVYPVLPEYKQKIFFSFFYRYFDIEFFK